MHLKRITSKRRQGWDNYPYDTVVPAILLQTSTPILNVLTKPTTIL